MRECGRRWTSKVLKSRISCQLLGRQMQHELTPKGHRCVRTGVILPSHGTRKCTSCCAHELVDTPESARIQISKTFVTYAQQLKQYYTDYYIACNTTISVLCFHGPAIEPAIDIMIITTTTFTPGGALLPPSPLHPG